MISHLYMCTFTLDQQRRNSEYIQLNEEGLFYGLICAKSKADSENTLVQPNQVNDPVLVAQLVKRPPG